MIAMKRTQLVIKRSGWPLSPPSSDFRYGECQKNHAASIGGHAIDGCLEFMAAGPRGTTTAFVCAACGCHRNFHRKEVVLVDLSDIVTTHHHPS